MTASSCSTFRACFTWIAPASDWALWRSRAWPFLPNVGLLLLKIFVPELPLGLAKPLSDFHHGLRLSLPNSTSSPLYFHNKLINLLHAWPCLVSTSGRIQLIQIGTVIILILQIRKPRHREVAQGLIAKRVSMSLIMFLTHYGMLPPHSKVLVYPIKYPLYDRSSAGF